MDTLTFLRILRIADDGLSTGAVVGIVVGFGCLLAIAIVVVCVITSRSKRKRRFRHTFSESIREKKGATITSLNRFPQKTEIRPNTVYSDMENGCVQLQVNLKNSVYNELTAVPFTQRVPSKHWESPDTKLLGSSATEEYKRGQRSSVLLRQGIPGTHLSRNISTKIPTRCHTKSNCSSIVSYDLGNPRNSSAVKRHSSLFFPLQTHRQRTDTMETARSSGIAMDLGDEMNKGESRQSDGTTYEITLGCGCMLAIFVVTSCIIKSRSKKKQSFRHTFSDTIKQMKGATLTSLSRFSGKVERRPDTVFYIIDKETETHSVRVQLQTSIHNVTTAVPLTQHSNSKKWESSDDSFLVPLTTEEHKRDNRSSALLLRHGNPQKPFSKNIYRKLPTRCRSNSDCSSVVSYNLSNAHNSQDSSLPSPQSHRQRADTIDTVRSSENFGDEMNKAWMLLENDYFRRHSVSHL